MSVRYNIEEAKDTWEAMLEVMQTMPRFLDFVKYRERHNAANLSCGLRDYSDCTGEYENNEWDEERLEFRSDYGVCRFVVWEENSKYVFKIPFENDEDFDYCLNEVQIYNEACARGCEKAFAWTDKMGDYTINGYSFPVYAMQKCYCSCPYNEQQHYDAMRAVWDELDEKPAYDFEDWFDDAYLDDLMERWMEYEWGPRIAHDVIELLADCQVEDLHYGNWGYTPCVRTPTEQLVIVDYAGYGVEVRASYYSRNETVNENDVECADYLDWHQNKAEEPVKKEPTWVNKNISEFFTPKGQEAATETKVQKEVNVAQWFDVVEKIIENAQKKPITSLVRTRAPIGMPNAPPIQHLFAPCA